MLFLCDYVEDHDVQQSARICSTLFNMGFVRTSVLVIVF